MTEATSFAFSKGHLRRGLGRAVRAGSLLAMSPAATLMLREHPIQHSRRAEIPQIRPLVPSVSTASSSREVAAGVRDAHQTDAHCVDRGCLATQAIVESATRALASGATGRAHQVHSDLRSQPSRILTATLRATSHKTTDVSVAGRPPRPPPRWSGSPAVPCLLTRGFSNSSSATLLIEGTLNVTTRRRSPCVQRSSPSHPDPHHRNQVHGTPDQEARGATGDPCDGPEHRHERSADDEPGDRSQGDLA